jgi:hypothetical protein
MVNGPIRTSQKRGHCRWPAPVQDAGAGAKHDPDRSGLVRRAGDGRGRFCAELPGAAHTLAGQTVDDFMTVKSGRRCSIVMLTSRGPMPTTRIVAPPAHCSAYIEAGNRIVYRSRPGYVNSDSFSYARGGMDALNKSITRTVQIGVTVTP